MADWAKRFCIVENRELSISVGLAVSLFLGCGSGKGGFGPGDELRSAHFAYFAEKGATYPPNVLEVLEAHRSDFGMILELPEDVITYHLVASKEEAADHCGHSVSQDACALRGAVISDQSEHFHELIHAYTYLRFGHVPSPLLAEGVAEAVSCQGGDLDETSIAYQDAQYDIDWRVAASLPALGHLDPYISGRRFVKYLVGLHGWARFWQYYDSDTYSLDPDKFAATFQMFFGERLDDVWAGMRRNTAVFSPTICPCSSPAALIEGDLREFNSDQDPFLYESLKQPPAASVLLKVPAHYLGALAACDGSEDLLLGAQLPSVAVLTADGPWRISAAPYAARSLSLSDSCLDGSAINVTAMDSLAVLTFVAKASAPTSEFLALQTDVLRQVKVEAPGRACDTCGTDDTSCTTLPGTTTWSGRKFLRLDNPRAEIDLKFSTP